MTDQTDKIQWHPGFCSAAELELIENKTELEFIREYNIGKEPLRIDLLIIKKRPGAVIKNEIGSIFKQHNLLEYKSPDDGFSIDDYYKAIGYACIYKSLGETVDAIPAQEITVSFFREAYPRELIKSLMRELQKHSGFKILSKNAREEDVRRFLETVSGYTKQGDKNNADAVLQVSVIANKKLYQAIRRDFGMCEALKELMKDEIDKEADLRAEMIVQIKVQEAEKNIRRKSKRRYKKQKKRYSLKQKKRNKTPCSQTLIT